jgi:hypothetical protein
MYVCTGSSACLKFRCLTHYVDTTKVDTFNSLLVFDKNDVRYI